MEPEHERGDELRRLRNGPRRDERPWPLVDIFDVFCSGDADEVLGRAKEVLGTILEQEPSDWPTGDRWRELLPAWFRERSPGYPSSSADAWSVESFTFRFREENRSWWWFDATIDSPDFIRVRVEVDGWPFGWEDLRWLFRVAGAHRVLESTEKQPNG